MAHLHRRVELRNGIPEYTIIKGVAWDHILYTRQLIDIVQQADAICYGTWPCAPPNPTPPSPNCSSTPSPKQ